MPDDRAAITGRHLERPFARREIVPDGLAVQRRAFEALQAREKAFKMCALCSLRSAACAIGFDEYAIVGIVLVDLLKDSALSGERV